jgi:aryl-alcohol dehydrogenase-like predicted oxidoreductase
MFSAQESLPTNRNSISVNGLPLSRLSVGTAQFGLPYGIANKIGQPSFKEVREILAIAYEGGINCLDTAVLYGMSESIIGQALHDLGLMNSFIVVTKVPPVPAHLTSISQIDDFVEGAVNQSLLNLRLDTLSICLFHRANDGRYLESLQRLHERGSVERVGVSVDSPNAASDVLAAGDMDVIQFPTNLLDKRFLKQGIFEEAKFRDTLVFVRSIFLQGAILMPVESLATPLVKLLPTLRLLRQVAHEHDIEIEELAFRYMLNQEGISSLVVGVESAKQMRHNVQLLNKGALPSALKDAVDSAVPEIAEEILNPSNWSEQSR